MVYNANSIKILKGLDAVRKRPGMYIGATKDPHQCLYEIVDNSVDEAMAGYGKNINVTIHPDNSVTVQDYGRGIPVGINKQTGKSTPEVIYTILHAGGKFTGKGAYQTAGGLHGVGASVVNALSVYLQVDIVRNNHHYREIFKNGGHPTKAHLVDLGATDAHTGTTVTFKPDPSIFLSIKMPYKVIKEHLREEAYLLKGIAINLTDERVTPERHEEFNGDIDDFVRYLNAEKSAIGNVMHFEGKKQGIKIKIAAQYTDGYNPNILSFVNNVRTPQGGTQIKGFKTAWTHTFNQYGKKIGLLRTNKDKLSGSDTREGLSAIIALWIPEELLEFEGQTKEKLDTYEAETATATIINEQLGYYLMKHGKFAQRLILKSSKAKEARDAARKARENLRKGNKKSKKKQLQLSHKLTPAQTDDASKKELFLVEGDSAGGSAKLGRDRIYQAILPLRGKVLNTERAKLSAVLKNQELSTIIYTVGAGAGSDFDIKKANYDKIIIMTDADDDGAHIQILLLTFFYNYMRPMITHGRVYIALPPLFKLQTTRGKTHIAYSWTRGQEYRQENNKYFKNNHELQRFKGLGEMDPDQLWETTMNPKTRTLIRVKISDAQLADKRVAILMGKKVSPRRNWINHHIQFTATDNDDAKVLHKHKK